MPSYTETFPCPVCCGTTTTTTTIGPTTTQQPGVCPEGYEPCGSSGGTWIVDTDCEWAFVNNDGCPEGCESFWITWPIVSVDDCFSTPQGTFGTGVCCRPITSTTTENPATTTCQPNEVIGYRLQDVFNEFSSVCKICVPALCGSEEPNIFTTCDECRDAANVFNLAQPFCMIYECSPTPPL